MPSVVPTPWGPYLSTEDPDVRGFGGAFDYGRNRDRAMFGMNIHQTGRRRRRPRAQSYDDYDDDEDYYPRSRRDQRPIYGPLIGPNEFYGPTMFDVLGGGGYHYLGRDLPRESRRRSRRPDPWDDDEDPESSDDDDRRYRREERRRPPMLPYGDNARARRGNARRATHPAAPWWF